MTTVKEKLDNIGFGGLTASNEDVINAMKNDKIKEILSNLKYCKDNDSIENYYPEDIFMKDDPYILYDYIIQLLNENKKLRNYKSINVKATEYVIYLGLKCKYNLNTGHLRKLKKILQGDYNE